MTTSETALEGESLLQCLEAEVKRVRDENLALRAALVDVQTALESVRCLPLPVLDASHFLGWALDCVAESFARQTRPYECIVIRIYFHRTTMRDYVLAPSVYAITPNLTSAPEP